MRLFVMLKYYKHGGKNTEIFHIAIKKMIKFRNWGKDNAVLLKNGR